MQFTYTYMDSKQTSPVHTCMYILLVIADTDNWSGKQLFSLFLRTIYEIHMYRGGGLMRTMEVRGDGSTGVMEVQVIEVQG